MRQDDEKSEMKELREEARYWRRQALKARRERDEARIRASDCAQPRVEIVRGETWWRVLVNGVRIDGYEDEDTAKTIKECLRRAFEVK